MSQRKAILILLLAVGLMFGVAGCKSKPVETAPPPPAPRAVEPEPEPEVVEVEPEPEPEVVIEQFVPPTIAALNAAGHLKTVYFDFDKYDLTESTRATLEFYSSRPRASSIASSKRCSSWSFTPRHPAMTLTAQSRYLALRS